MSRYLSALKMSEKDGDGPNKPKQPPFPSSLGYLGTPPLAFEINQSANDDRHEALAAAIADPDNALSCYTAIASERSPTPTDYDDRHTCRQCLNLRGGGCSVATPGGALSAHRGYRPGELFQDEPHRCEAFTERTTP